jgi:uroporphyrinogen-III synthase
MASPDLLILRPQPGAEATRAHAEALGLSSLVAPIFHIVPLPWAAPPAEDYQAIVFTSAHAPRQAGPALADYRTLPCYAVGDASAEAARQAGFTDVRTGPSNAVALAALMRDHDIARALHLCGREHLALDLEGVDRRVVYAADALPFLLPDAVAALRTGAVALLHSARVAAHFTSLVDGAGLDRNRIPLAAISKAAATAAGPGWQSVTVAPAPRDAALLEVAAKLCKDGRPREPR